MCHLFCYCFIVLLSVIAFFLKIVVKYILHKNYHIGLFLSVQFCVKYIHIIVPPLPFCKIETLPICERKTSLSILRTLDFTSYVGFSYTEQFSNSLQTSNGCPTFQFNPDTTQSQGQIPQVKGSVTEDCLSPPTRHFRCQSKSRWAPALLTNWYKSKIPKTLSSQFH